MNKSQRNLRNILKTTDHRGTYNRASKNLYAECPLCRWHASFWRCCFNQSLAKMTYSDDLDGTPYKLRFMDHYNWKLVSKNKKQWMRKNMRARYRRYDDGCVRITFGF
ncbi:hypothetical protein SAMN05428949_4560 [Chitinophaga sp. YR627]|uniref:hypothetical protein n=1 Tax=Chitinophaga sp. YR627 TaxID=1881041 RepID=UPI0008F2F775|nr:hypothetical protein [Chitinophaga sp. YR627]SFO22781.1 hypothetical protein SAMN05428949_4560 [Chitinophaga sp. YR627]